MILQHPGAALNVPQLLLVPDVVTDRACVQMNVVAEGKMPQEQHFSVLMRDKSINNYSLLIIIHYAA